MHLKHLEFFRDFTNTECEALRPFIHAETYKKGEWIIREGDFHKELVILESGAAELFKEEEGIDAGFELATLHAGEWIGEMSFVEKQRRFASMRATTQTQVLFLDLQAIEAHPSAQSAYEKIM